MTTLEFIKYLESKIDTAVHFNSTEEEHIISFNLIDGATVTILIE